MSTVAPPIWGVVEGDIGDYIVAKLSGVTDLTSVTIVKGFVSADGFTTTELSGSVVDAVARHVRINMGNASGWLATLDIGDIEEVEFELQIELTFADGTELTWPYKGKGKIVVTKQKG